MNDDKTSAEVFPELAEELVDKEFYNKVTKFHQRDKHQAKEVMKL